MKSKEKPIENAILEYLKWLGVFCWKNQSVGVYDPIKKIYRKSHNKHHILGVSDILGIINSKPLAIEVKSNTGRASIEQKMFLDHFREQGGIGFIARSVDDVKRNLSQFFPSDDRFKRAHQYIQPNKITEQ